MASRIRVPSSAVAAVSNAVPLAHIYRTRQLELVFIWLDLFGMNQAASDNDWNDVDV